MQVIRWLLVLVILVHVGSLFSHWIEFPETGVEVGGFYATGKHLYGQPGWLHLVPAAILLILVLIGRDWSKAAAFFTAIFILVWSVVHFINFSACVGPQCPERGDALFMMLATGILMPLLVLFLGRSRK
ncbi:MAG TPA: hypothetical protein VFZ78_07750 [Flavisolibacter sp.]